MTAMKPEDCDRLFADGVNAGDAAAVASLYEPEGVLLLDGQTYRGPDAIRAVLDGMIGGQARIRMNVKQVVAAGDVAMVYNDWHLSVAGPDGKREESSGQAIEVVRRQADGSWKYVIDDPRARG